MTNDSFDARHVDVAILFGLGMKNRAHALALQLYNQPPEVDATITADRQIINERAQDAVKHLSNK